MEIPRPRCLQARNAPKAGHHMRQPVIVDPVAAAVVREADRQIENRAMGEGIEAVHDDGATAIGSRHGGDSNRVGVLD